jgi:2-haloacid dehalogenase
MTARPAVVAFDVIETLMSIEPLRGRLTDAGQPPQLLDIWYARILRDGMALSAAGDYADFPSVAGASLRSLADGSISDEQVAAVVSALGDLPAFPDALPAVKSLAEGGVRVVCLTNGRADTTASFSARTGLDPFIERVISVGEVFRWKPAAVVYRYAAEVLGVWPERMALVAAHDWDCHGAKRAGMTTGWVHRAPGGSGGYGAYFAPPDVTGADLTEVAAKLLALEPLPG